MAEERLEAARQIGRQLAKVVGSSPPWQSRREGRGTMDRTQAPEIVGRMMVDRERGTIGGYVIREGDYLISALAAAVHDRDEVAQARAVVEAHSFRVLAKYGRGVRDGAGAPASPGAPFRRRCRG